MNFGELGKDGLNVIARMRAFGFARQLTRCQLWAHARVFLAAPPVSRRWSRVLFVSGHSVVSH